MTERIYGKTKKGTPVTEEMIATSSKKQNAGTSRASSAPSAEGADAHHSGTQPRQSGPFALTHHSEPKRLVGRSTTESLSPRSFEEHSRSTCEAPDGSAAVADLELQVASLFSRQSSRLQVRTPNMRWAKAVQPMKLGTEPTSSAD